MKKTTSKKTSRVPARKKASAKSGVSKRANPPRAAAIAAPAAPAAKKIKLSREDKKKYTDILLAMREKIENQINFLANDTLKNPESDIPKDEGTEDFGRDFALNILSSEHDFKFEINDALRRIHEGTFGRCEQCGNAIAKMRLSAIPFARTCVTCQSTIEKNKPRHQAFGSNATESVRLSSAGGAGSDE